MNYKASVSFKVPCCSFSVQLTEIKPMVFDPVSVCDTAIFGSMATALEWAGKSGGSWFNVYTLLTSIAAIFLAS